MTIDIMIGDRYFNTFRGNVNTMPVVCDGAEVWMADMNDIRQAVMKRFTSLEGKEFTIEVCNQ